MLKVLKHVEAPVAVAAKVARAPVAIAGEGAFSTGGRRRAIR